jgi:succinyl-diaminopimelate desuccinylase
MSSGEFDPETGLMDLKDPVSLTQALVHCPSVTPKEGGALTLLQNFLEAHGFEVHRMTMREEGTSDVENLYARYGRQGPNLCFAGHTDVVPPGDEASWTHPPFAGEIVDGVMYGRGTVDMKGGIACFIAAALRVIKHRGVRGSISLLITGDEEGPSINGTVKVLDWLESREERLDACVVGEPTNPDALGDMIKIGRRGSLTGELIVAGRQGHAAYPHQADNPVPKLAQLIDRLNRLEIDGGSKNFERSNLEVTVISVPNAAANVIPASARAVFNIRYNDNWTRKTMSQWVKERIGQIAAEIGAEVSVTCGGTGDVFLTKPGPLVDAMRDAIHEATGRTAELSTSGGTSDARFIQAMCPVIEFGLVNQTIHQVDEHVPVEDLEKLTDIYERFIDGYFARDGI